MIYLYGIYIHYWLIPVVTFLTSVRLLSFFPFNLSSVGLKNSWSPNSFGASTIEKREREGRETHNEEHRGQSYYHYYFLLLFFLFLFFFLCLLPPFLPPSPLYLPLLSYLIIKMMERRSIQQEIF